MGKIFFRNKNKYSSTIQDLVDDYLQPYYNGEGLNQTAGDHVYDPDGTLDNTMDKVVIFPQESRNFRVYGSGDRTKQALNEAKAAIRFGNGQQYHRQQQMPAEEQREHYNEQAQEFDNSTDPKDRALQKQIASDLRFKRFVNGLGFGIAGAPLAIEGVPAAIQAAPYLWSAAQPYLEAASSPLSTLNNIYGSANLATAAQIGDAALQSYFIADATQNAIEHPSVRSIGTAAMVDVPLLGAVPEAYKIAMAPFRKSLYMSVNPFGYVGHYNDIKRAIKNIFAGLPTGIPESPEYVSDVMQLGRMNAYALNMRQPKVKVNIVNREAIPVKYKPAFISNQLPIFVKDLPEGSYKTFEFDNAFTLNRDGRTYTLNKDLLGNQIKEALTFQLPDGINPNYYNTPMGKRDINWFLNKELTPAFTLGNDHPGVAAPALGGVGIHYNPTTGQYYMVDKWALHPFNKLSLAGDWGLQSESRTREDLKRLISKTPKVRNLDLSQLVGGNAFVTQMSIPKTAVSGIPPSMIHTTPTNLNTINWTDRVWFPNAKLTISPLWLTTKYRNNQDNDQETDQQE